MQNHLKYLHFKDPVCSVWDKGYRYGFNSMEKDNEINVNGGSYDFGARIYDSRLGRWLSLDPLMRKYPDLTPYCSMGDNPIYFIDPDGMVIINPYDYNKEEEKSNYLLVQNAIEILKLTLPELYDKLHNDKSIEIIVKINEKYTPTADNSTPGSRTVSNTKTESLCVNGVCIYEQYTELPKSIIVKQVEENKTLITKYFKRTPVLNEDNTTKKLDENGKVIYEQVEITKKEADEIIGRPKSFEINLGNLVFTSLMGQLLAHELGHSEFGHDNPTDDIAFKDANENYAQETEIIFASKVKNSDIKIAEKNAKEQKKD